MAGEARHCWIMALDIENFSTRLDPVQRSLRGAMYETLGNAAERAGLPVAETAFEDRGDGVLMIVPGTASPVDLAGRFVRELDDELAQKSMVFGPGHAMRFRLALHQGLASPDATGWSGDAVNTTCRLVDAQPLRDVLAEALSARMVFVVSAEVYRGVVRHHHRGIDPAAYAPMRFVTKHGETIESWVMVPGYPAPPGLAADTAGSRAAAPAGHEGGVQEAGQRTPGPSGKRQMPSTGEAPPSQVTFNAGVVHGDQVAGDKTVTVHTTGAVRP